MKKTVSFDIERVISEATVAEKVELLCGRKSTDAYLEDPIQLTRNCIAIGKDAWHTFDIPRLNVLSILCTDWADEVSSH